MPDSMWASIGLCPHHPGPVEREEGSRSSEFEATCRTTELGDCMEGGGSGSEVENASNREPI